MKVNILIIGDIVGMSGVNKVKEILVGCMENAAKLLVPLKVEVEEGENWYDAK